MGDNSIAASGNNPSEFEKGKGKAVEQAPEDVSMGEDEESSSSEDDAPEEVSLSRQQCSLFLITISFGRGEAHN